MCWYKDKNRDTYDKKNTVKFVHAFHPMVVCAEYSFFTIRKRGLPKTKAQAPV
jgi:hypothetical protein